MECAPAYLKRFRLIVVIFRVYREGFIFRGLFSTSSRFPSLSRGINQVVHRKLADVVIDVVVFLYYSGDDDAFARCASTRAGEESFDCSREFIRFDEEINQLEKDNRRYQIWRRS